MCALPLAEDPFRCHKDYLPCTLYLSRVGVHALCNVLSISKILGVSRTSSAFCGRVRRRAHRVSRLFLARYEDASEDGRERCTTSWWLADSFRKKETAKGRARCSARCACSRDTRSVACQGELRQIVPLSRAVRALVVHGMHKQSRSFVGRWGGRVGDRASIQNSRKRTNFKEHQTLRMNLVCVMKEGSFPVGNILLKMGSTLGVASTPVPAQRAVDSMLSGNQAVCATTSSAGATIAAKLLQQGLSDTAMRNARTSFHSTTLQPRRYADPPWLLKPNCIRVVALMLSDEGLSGRNGTRLANLAIRAGHELRAALPEGSQFWMPKAASLHATVFHPSEEHREWQRA